MAETAPEGLTRPIPGPHLRPLVDLMIDPTDYYFRYPAARGLLRILGWLPVTPNQVTIFHGLLGQVCAGLVAFGGQGALPLAFVLLEIRGVLDCYDGVLARAKRLSSPYGRAMDEMMDATSFVAVNLAIAWRVHTWQSLALALIIIPLTALTAWSYDFFRRKFAGAIEHGTDAIVQDLRPRVAAIAEGLTLGLLTRVSYWFDTRQVRILSAHSADETLARARDANASLRSPDVDRVLDAANSGRFRLALRALSLMAGDNIVTLIGLGLLVGRLWETQLLVVAYGLTTLLTGVGLGARILRGGRRVQP